MEKYGIVFDMDGVISDTQKYHGQIEVEIFHQYNITTIDPNSPITLSSDWIGKNFAGVQPKEWMKSIFEKHGKSNQFNIHEIEDKKNQLLLQKYTLWDTPIEFVPGAKELLSTLFDSAMAIYKIFVVTASTRQCMEQVLSTLWIKEKFDEVISIYDIDPQTQKPYISKWEPEVYMRLQQKYNFEKFLMIEDGTTGMNGAIKAWWKAIAILGDNTKEKFPQAVSWHKDLRSIKVELLYDILNTIY